MNMPQRKGPSGPVNDLGSGKDRYQWSGGLLSEEGFESDIVDGIVPTLATPEDGGLQATDPESQFIGAQRINYIGNLILGSLELVNIADGNVATFEDDAVFTLRVGSLAELYPFDSMLPAKAQLVVPGGTALAALGGAFESTDWTEPGGGAPVLSVPVTEGQWALISFDTGGVQDTEDTGLWVGWVLEG